jgi:preprotein translocase subunit SecG
MHTVLIVIHVFLSVGLVGLILVQHGKGADAGAAFGSGASATVFGSQGSANFLSRTTAVLATCFFLTSLALGWFAMQTHAPKKGLMGDLDNAQIVPATPDLELPPAPEAEQATGGESEVPRLEVPELNETEQPGEALPEIAEETNAEPEATDQQSAPETGDANSNAGDDNATGN